MITYETADKYFRYDPDTGHLYWKVRNSKRAKDVARVGGKRIGLFTTPEEAYAAYCKAARELFGEFAR